MLDILRVVGGTLWLHIVNVSRTEIRDPVTQEGRDLPNVKSIKINDLLKSRYTGLQFKKRLIGNVKRRCQILV